MTQGVTLLQILFIIIHTKVQLFILQTRGEKVRLSACGMFKLGKHLFPSVIGCCTKRSSSWAALSA